MNRLPDHDLSAGFATKDEQEQKEEEHHEQEQEVSASSRLAENTGEQVHLSEDDNDDALADSDSEEVDRWVGHFLRTRVKDLAPPYGCRCDENATALSPFPPPPLPQNPDAIRDYLYWNDDENCKPWWEPLSQCVDSALGGDGDAQCVLGLKDIFTPEPPSRFSGRRQQAAPEASVWLVAAAKRSHPLALHVLAHCRRQGNPFPWTLPPAVEAPGVLTWFRALATAGEYYAQHTLSEMYLVGARVGLPRALEASEGRCSLAARGLAYKWWSAVVTCRHAAAVNGCTGVAASWAWRRMDLLARCCRGCSARHH